MVRLMLIRRDPSHPSMPKFIIVTPGYVGNSFGIKTLHYLAHTLNEEGFDARLMFMTDDGRGKQRFGYAGREATNPAFNTPPMTAADGVGREADIVVYPEIVSNNPLNARNVVRYFLNVDGKITGRRIALGPTDFRLAFHRMFRADAHFVLGNAEFNPAFQMGNGRPIGERTLDLTYIGKGDMYGKAAAIKNSILITRAWPSDQNQLAQLLRHTRFFYSWDSVTSLNVEAILCGAMPVILRYEPIRKEDFDATELGPLPHLDMGVPNFKFDPQEFNRSRAALIGRISEIQNSWGKRVNAFATAAFSHFAAKPQLAVPVLQ